jgi:hypothetical protein
VSEWQLTLRTTVGKPQSLRRSGRHTCDEVEMVLVDGAHCVRGGANHHHRRRRRSHRRHRRRQARTTRFIRPPDKQTATQRPTTAEPRSHGGNRPCTRCSCCMIVNLSVPHLPIRSRLSTSPAAAASLWPRSWSCARPAGASPGAQRTGVLVRRVWGVSIRRVWGVSIRRVWGVSIRRVWGVSIRRVWGVSIRRVRGVDRWGAHHQRDQGRDDVGREVEVVGAHQQLGQALPAPGVAHPLSVAPETGPWPR